jgi:acetyltransferase-like isoleucine patch superfamily enzyme
MGNKLIGFFKHRVLQLKGRILLRKKVGILGDFTVVSPKNVTIGDHCGINHGVFILGHHRIDIGSYVVLSARCMLIDAGLDKTDFYNNAFPKHVDGPIRIDDGAWIGAGAIILANVTVGKKAIVGAGSVVTRDVPSYAIVAGSPAKVIGWTNE